MRALILSFLTPATDFVIFDFQCLDTTKCPLELQVFCVVLQTLVLHLAFQTNVMAFVSLLLKSLKVFKALCVHSTPFYFGYRFV